MRVLFFFSYLLCLPAMAQTVYRTVENGVVTFSDTPPEDGKAEIIDMPELPPVNSDLLDQRLSAMRETTDRMAEDRREREKHRAELRVSRAQEQPVPVVETPATAVVGAYWRPRQGIWRPGRPPNHRPPYRPIPAPLPSPASPPGWSVMQPGNAQLMRPIVSSRR